MDNDKIIRIAKKIIVGAVVDEKLAKLMNKKSVVNYFHRLVGGMPGMQSSVNDDGWGHVHDVFNKIRETGVDLTVDTDPANGGDYFYNDNFSRSSISPDKRDQALCRGDAPIGGKQWNLKIEFDGMKHWVLSGYLKAIFKEPGFLDSPYELIFYLW